MENTNNKKLGWIGLGSMGIPMASNLIDSKYEVVVYNRTRSKEEKLRQAGATSASDPKDLMEKSDIVFIMISDDDAVREVFKGENGLLQASLSGKVVINMSTVSPGISEEMAASCIEKGCRYADAPVSGSVKQATDASLVIMFGGDQKLYEEVKSLLEVLGKTSFYLGEVGSGNKAKLAVNFFLATVTQGLAEMVVFAQKNGIKKEDILEVINSGGLASPYTKIKSKSIVEDDFPPAFALKHMTKDIRLAVENDLDTPLSAVLLDTFRQAQDEHGEEDVMAVYKGLRE